MMTNKPVITADQETAIENLKCRHHKSVIIKMHSQDNRWDEPYEPLNDLELDDFIKILYTDIGYEVEPEHKEGDWCMWLKDNPKPQTPFKLKRAADGRFFPDEWPSPYCGGESISPKNLRHATESEIQQEKERRFWHGNGREVWELREGDFISNQSGVSSVVERVKTDEVRFEGFVLFDEIKDIKPSCRVACFAENRLDSDIHDQD